MSTFERIFHAVLFEVLAVSLSILGLIIFTEHNPQTLSGTMIVVASIAMVWNFIFNYIFDRFFPGNREERTMKLRIFFVILFEAGLLFFTIPVMAYILNVSLIDAFWLDIGVTIFITIYALVFNYAYDNIRAFIIKKRRTELHVGIEY
ncbi:PACE efflux transporter [Photobacterium frigidiphilum]|uniref:PACE efflux transporter n=1 Tax=Photobacterium frigidiphilum TaxID=264736 RepID=UPI003D0F3237